MCDLFKKKKTSKLKEKFHFNKVDINDRISITLNEIKSMVLEKKVSVEKFLVFFLILY